MAYRSHVVPVNDEVGWNDALRFVPHAYWHTWQANRALHLGSRHEIFLFVYVDEGLGSRSVLPFAIRRWRDTLDVFSPGGVSGFATNGPSPDARLAWESFARDHHFVCGYFALHPILGIPDMHRDLAITNELFLLDMRGGAMAAVAAFHPDTRRRLKNWRQSGLSVEQNRALLTRFLQDEYEPFMRTSGAREASIWPRATLDAICEDSNTFLVGVSDEDGICAASIFTRTPHCAEYLANVRVRQGKAYAPLLITAALEWLESWNVPWLNLGGGVKRGDSIARSKLRLHPQSVPLWSAREIYSPADYDRLAGQDERLTNYFPSYRSGPEE
jgi:hypothetical protein